MENIDTKQLDSEELVNRRLEELIDFRTDGQDLQEFWGKQFDLGLAWVQFPEGSGGLGLNPKYQMIITERLRSEGISQQNRIANILGVGMGAPTIIEYGTPEQIQKYLKPMFTAEEIWCQLFSEPGSGSDLASLSTKAVDDGDGYIVNGQKVWTTLGHLAKWGLLVTRTDPNAPKHRGLTFFIVDMESAGVEVRPLRQITGEAEFNEVYFTDTKIPKENILGGLGEGWRVSLATLMNERVAIGGNVRERGSGAPGHLVQIWKDKDLKDPIQKDKLIELWIQQEAVRLTNIRASELREKGTPGPEGSTSKLYEAEINKASYEFGMELLGNDGLLFPRGYSLTQPELNFDNDTFGFTDTQSLFLRSRANSIEGGTSEIMRNIIAERVLGLPGEQKLDKDKPWKDIPRS
ncbi:acyl-CoA dehydrogenase family protein [Acidimicrobiia bacterium]|jgi:alkylation response protein AidB-like acyl-CoA dehydrogenase|nr:acyl-CoA dehydrogenase [Actinomycetota bacterium]MDA7542970.1 acyl-CoA dehydrogenase family protein [Acidimicrobiia bacterium]MDA7850572.1 acyl-CoA dehydrogenase family protein [Acidimicrobiaceae bacterium]MDA8652926.1 acyl-CoA dehydrogenase family protein [Candidatus Actinomarina sp.]MDA7548186.1 acyl-CoA dehydrogenase family protein [Acidimicrobiia bacterium]|tara:strand:- start:2002 stop:3219 length:1218 start_codon:yes stop_codon:yes gene_type:complete